MTQSNDLRYVITKINGDEKIVVNIRLNDECKNGHQDFAITADIFEKSDRGGWRWSSGGCQHEEIVKHFPEFQIFVDLHLCDYKGIPMHATANGFYHLTHGLGNIMPDNDKFKDRYCKYYRISSDQYDVLSTSKSEIQFYLHLLDLHILEQWEAEAKKAIKILEGLTDKEFILDSKRTQLIVPSDAEIQEEKNKIASGYYTEEAERSRYEAKVAAKITDMREDIENEYKEQLIGWDLKSQVLKIGGFTALDDCIYYPHTKTLSFNWRTYSKGISQELYNKIASEINLPEGIKISFGK